MRVETGSMIGGLIDPDVEQRLWLMEDGSVHMGWAPPSP